MLPMRKTPCVCALLCLWLAPAGLLAQPDPTGPSAQSLDSAGSPSRSIGSPTAGELQGGVALPAAGPGFMANPRRSAEARYGTIELIRTLMAAAAASHPGGDAEPLVVNDISLQHGGPIPHHGSHQNGRDVDLLFFLTDLKGRPRPAVGAPLRPDGTGVDYHDLAILEDDEPLRIDLPRTWHFIAALLEHGGDQVQRIFIVEHLRTLLLREARRQQAPKALRQRFADLACQPGTPHDDHMHVRFYCSVQDLQQGCLDKPPYYPFRRAQLARAGVQPAWAGQRTRAERRAAKARTVTPEQARKRAGELHPTVVAFLEARKAWQKKTTPPRRYCK